MIIKKLLIILLSIGYIKSCHPPEYFHQNHEFMQWIHSNDQHRLLSRYHQNPEFYVALCEIYAQAHEIYLMRQDNQFKQYCTLIRQQSRIDRSLIKELHILQSYNPLSFAVILPDIQNYTQQTDIALQKYRTWKDSF